MTSRFVGRLNWAPQDLSDPKGWRLEEPFGFLRSDGILICCRVGPRVNGASIPRFLWPIPWIGHPFEGGNKFWSVPHDYGYHGVAIVVARCAMEVMSAEQICLSGGVLDLPSSMIIANRSIPRKWWDQTLVQAMVASGERMWKIRHVYPAVRLCGGRSYKPI